MPSRFNADGTPSDHSIRADGAIPWASQIPDNSGMAGETVGASLDLIKAGGDRLKAIAADLDLQTLNDDVSIALGGLAADAWMPTMAIVHIKAITGAASGDAAISIGTAAGGTQILAATVLTGVNAVGERMAIDLSGTVRAAIAAGDTIHVRCTTADTGVGTVLTADVHLYGEIM